jgi:hypothetical protein
MTAQNHDEMMAELQRYAERTGQIIERLDKELPGVPYMTKVIMAGDFEVAERAEKAFRAGEIDFDRAMLMCGSYSRLDFAVRMQKAGLVPLSKVLKVLPDEWPSCDPDDTDPRFIQLWKDAYWANGYKYLRDGPPLPRRKTLTVYRGQPEGAPLGLAWSLDEEIAGRFARGAWARTPVAGGEIITAKVPRSDVLAYLTRRNESEVILDPNNLERVK